MSGPISGRPEREANDHFDRVEREIFLKAKAAKICLHVCNPKRFCPNNLPGWSNCLRLCVAQLAQCGAIALLRGWEQSRGARLELKLAQDLRIPVVYVEPPAGPLDLSDIFAAAPETLRYYNQRLSRWHREGAEASAAEERAAAELANRFLDPYGYEYITNATEEN